MTASLRTKAGRLPWLALGGLHVAVLLTAMRAGAEQGWHAERIASVFALLGVIVFFALKTVDVAWLRFACSRRGFVAFCVATAIVHHDAVPASPHAPAVVLSAAAAGASLATLARRRSAAVLLRHLLSGLAALFTAPASPALESARVRSTFSPFSPAALRRTAPPRGPPSM